MKRKQTKAKRQITRKEQRQQELRLHLLMIVISIVVFLIIAVVVIQSIQQKLTAESASDHVNTMEGKYVAEQPELDVQLLPMNEYSRPGLALDQVNGIVVHYTANPGTTAQQNRDYFAGLAESKETKASSHFVIGLSGEIIQCIPCNEMSYASNDRNSDTISIECCIADDSGKFNDKTYDALVRLVTWLMGRYDLSTEAVIRHYDVTGKLCPKYFVEHPSAWDQFKVDLENYIEKYGVVRGSADDPAATEE